MVVAAAVVVVCRGWGEGAFTALGIAKNRVVCSGASADST